MKRIPFVVISIFILFTSIINSQNIESLISPFKGSEVVGTHEAQFASLTLLVEPLTSKNPTKIEVEGALSSIIYQRPANISPFQIYKSYLKILQQADFDILLECKEGKCNSKKSIKTTYGHPNKEIEDRKYSQLKGSLKTYLVGWGNHYISAKKKTAENLYYVMIIISNKKNLYSIDVLTSEEMEDGNVELDPALLKDKIESEGKVILQGLYFETGKAILKDESKPALDAITNYLNQNSNLSFYVVGHTDDEGSTVNNIELSEQRAETVLNALKLNGVDISKLTAYGVGPFSPALTNKTESGRKENRRVELVLRLNN